MAVMAKLRSGLAKDDTKQQKIIEMLNFTPGKADDDMILDDLLTPPSKGDNFQDTPLAPFSAGLSQPETELNGSYTEACRRPLGRFLSFDVKRSLFPGNKRRLEAGSDVDDVSPTAKRLRETQTALRAFTLGSPLAVQEEEAGDVKTAVQRLATDDNLLADGSRTYTLPVLRAGKHQDLKAISANTLRDVLDGCYDDQVGRVTVIDCRYPYEYEGGHIKDAINLFTQDSVLNFLHHRHFAPPTTCKDTACGTDSSAPRTEKHILVFHCEFSSERGPKMYRYLRSQDRDLNKEQYPALHFPEVYLLEGGYKAFYHTHKNHCFPPTYMPMNHKDYAAELRHFRGKSKSWTAGERKPMSRFSLRF